MLVTLFLMLSLAAGEAGVRIVRSHLPGGEDLLQGPPGVRHRHLPLTLDASAGAPGQGEDERLGAEHRVLPEREVVAEVERLAELSEAMRREEQDATRSKHPMHLGQRARPEHQAPARRPPRLRKVEGGDGDGKD